MVKKKAFKAYCKGNPSSGVSCANITLVIWSEVHSKRSDAEAAESRHKKDYGCKCTGVEEIEIDEKNLFSIEQKDHSLHFRATEIIAKGSETRKCERCGKAASCTKCSKCNKWYCAPCGIAHVWD